MTPFLDSSCTNVRGLFYDIRLYTLSCSSGVVLCVFHYINEIRNVRRLITYLFYFIQYINTTTHSIKDLNLFWLYLCIVFIADICITIKSYQSNHTHSTTWQTLMSCKYSSYFIPFYNLQYMYIIIYLVWSTIYAKKNQIPPQNEITYFKF